MKYHAVLRSGSISWLATGCCLPPGFFDTYVSILRLLPFVDVDPIFGDDNIF